MTCARSWPWSSWTARSSAYWLRRRGWTVVSRLLLRLSSSSSFGCRCRRAPHALMISPSTPRASACAGHSGGWVKRRLCRRDEDFPSGSAHRPVAVAVLQSDGRSTRRNEEGSNPRPEADCAAFAPVAAFSAWAFRTPPHGPAALREGEVIKCRASGPPDPAVDAFSDAGRKSSRRPVPSRDRVPKDCQRSGDRSPQRSMPLPAPTPRR